MISLKYYTKEWYKALQQQDYLENVRMIEDSEYTENELLRWYEKRLKEEIEKAKIEYNTPPFFPISIENIQEENFEFGDWIMFEKDIKETIPIASAMEARTKLEMYQHKIMKEFEERPPFNKEKEIEKEFKRNYQERMKYLYNEYPDWVIESVDKRLLALKLLPKSIFEKLQEIVNKSQDMVETIEDLVEQEKEKQKEQISKDIWNIIYGELADSILLKMERKEKNLYIFIQKITMNYPNDEPLYKIIKFYNCNIIEKENGIIKKDGEKIGSCNVELYKKENGYLLEFLIFAEELKYMTIEFENVKSEIIENISLI